MVKADMILDEVAVNEYLIDHGLEDGFVEPDAYLLQLEGTAAGAPCVMITVKAADGSMLLLKTPLEMLEVIARTMRARVEYLREQRST